MLVGDDLVMIRQSRVDVGVALCSLFLIQSSNISCPCLIFFCFVSSTRSPQVVAVVTSRDCRTVQAALAQITRQVRGDGSTMHGA